jgi:endothelin-converting enzyme
MSKHSDSRVTTTTPTSPRHQNVPRNLEASSAEVCQTDACKQYAQTILTNMSPKWQELDPCTDFDALTCDGFRETHNYKDYKSRVSTMDIVQDEVENLLVSLFNGSIAYKPVDEIDKSNWNTMKTVYDTCMNEDAIFKYGYGPVQKKLADFEKVFPVNGPALTAENKADLTDAAIWLFRKGNFGLFSAHVTVSRRVSIS